MDTLKRKFTALLPSLNGRGRRVAVAAEARALGYGGVAKVARASGVSVSTIWRGLRELKQAYGELYAEVSRLVHEADPIRLIAIGAPDDEYDVEVSTILPRLHEATSASDVHRIVYEEFVHWFDADIAGPPEIYCQRRSGTRASDLRKRQTGRLQATTTGAFGEVAASRCGGRS